MNQHVLCSYSTVKMLCLHWITVWRKQLFILKTSETFPIRINIDVWFPYWQHTCLEAFMLYILSNSLSFYEFWSMYLLTLEARPFWTPCKKPIGLSLTLSAHLSALRFFIDELPFRHHQYGFILWGARAYVAYTYQHRENFHKPGPSCTLDRLYELKAA